MTDTWTGARSVARWYCVVVAAFLTIRAGTTLLAGADFALPGDGWRSIWQLGTVLVLAAGIVRNRAAPIAVTIVGVMYAVVTVLELFHGTSLLGIVPVDMRDRVVHPLLAVGAACCVLGSRSRATALPSPR